MIDSCLYGCYTLLNRNAYIKESLKKGKIFMTGIFIAYAQEDSTCADEIGKELEARGYQVWRDVGYTGADNDYSYQGKIESALLGSAAVVPLWSSNTVGLRQWVEQHVLFAQRLQKLIFPVLLDGTQLPSTLAVATTIVSQGPCSAVAAQLLPQLPPPNSADPLLKLCEGAANDAANTRREAIEQAAGMLKRGEHREAVLALLEYLAQKDLYTSVRDRAKEVLSVDAVQDAPSPFRADEAKYIFEMRCKKCGHLSYFDRRRVCRLKKDGVRQSKMQAGKKLDVLRLNCEKCGAVAFVDVDCEGYR